MTSWLENAAPEICIGRVFHKRLRPAAHQFSYGVFFLRLPLSRIGTNWAIAGCHATNSTCCRS